MSETTQRIRDIRTVLEHAKKYSKGCHPYLIEAKRYVADVEFLLSLLDTWENAKFIKVTEMDHEQQLRDIRFTISNDATMMALIQEAALSCQPHADEYRRRLQMGIELLVQAFGTHAVQMKEMQAELAKLRYEAECQPSSPSGSAASCTPCCTPLSEDAKRAIKIAANNIRRDTEPDEDDDDEGLDTPDLETAVAIPECTCPPDHPLLSGHLPTCPCNRG